MNDYTITIHYLWIVFVLVLGFTLGYYHYYFITKLKERDNG